MTRTLLTLVFALLVVAPRGSTAGADEEESPQAPLRRVYVTALDANGSPVPDLAPGDLTIKEDGKTRTVVRVEQTNGPLSIALLVDDAGVGINDIRSGLAGFIQRVQGKGEVALISVAPVSTKIVDFTADPVELIAGVRTLVGRASPRGGHLIASIGEAATDVAERKGERRAIVVIAIEGDEYSSIQADDVLARVAQSRAVMHVVTVGKPTLTAMPPLTPGPRGDTLEQENTQRGKLLSEGPRQSGGRRSQLMVPEGIPKALAQIAVDLTHQYSVLYETDESKPARKLAVSTGRRGVTVLAPTRLYVR
jgi:VWFA-related protein